MTAVDATAFFAIKTHEAPAAFTTRASNGRGDRIRTCDILVPNQARYQAALLPEALPLARF